MRRFAPGDRLVVAHHVPCFDCHYCRRGSPSMCRHFKRINLDPGGFAELVRVPAPNVEHAAFRLPAEMTDEAASFTEPLACCLRAVKRSRVAAGDTALVVGLGSIGCLLAQLLALEGVRVLASDLLEPPARAGAPHGRAGAATTDAALDAALREATEGRGADLVIVTAGGAAALPAAAARVRDGGTLHYFAGGAGDSLPLLARRALPSRADPHRHLFVLAGRARGSLRAAGGRPDPGGRPHQPPAPARAPGRRRRADAPPRGGEGLRDPVAMRAQVFHGPGDLRFEDLPVPEPEPGGLVMRVDAALTCGTDVKTLRRGHPVMIPHVPTVFGHELAGVVTAVRGSGPGVKEGDRVVAANSAPCGRCRLCAAGRPNLCEDLLFVNGAYGQYIALPPRLVAGNVVPIGPGLAASSAAFAEPLACALLGVERGRVEAGMTVAIWGHGPLGCLLALAARQRGAQVVMVGKAGWRLDRVRELGLGTCVDALSTPDMGGYLRAADRRPGARGHRGRHRSAGGLGASHRWRGPGRHRGTVWRLRARHLGPGGHASGALRRAHAGGRLPPHPGHDPPRGGTT